MSEKMFPIMDIQSHSTEYIPWFYLSGCAERALKNHGQSLETLAQRGGLSWCEALALMEDRPWCRMDNDEAKRKVHQIIARTCKKCHGKLKWGDFAYNQEICWDCFVKEVDIMSECIDQYPTWMRDKINLHKDILKHLLATCGECHGKKI